MVKYSCYFLFLLCFCYLLVSSVLLFIGGFLLSRSAQPNKATGILYNSSECSYKDDQCINSREDELYHISLKKQICTLTKHKVIVLVIDGLRYDFTLYNDSLDVVLPYQNKLPIIKELLETKPDKTRLYKFIADPPTTTMQRLKGITTGTLPTFIDAGSNFGATEINEDNLIEQLISSKKKAVFMGDDTWMGLYPNMFLRSYPFPSFNVFDLDTVDRGVEGNLNTEIEKNDWDLLIGHFLGVDHCGHRYGPLHSEMSRKLSEMNAVISDVSNNLPNDTMLFVIGDHGMTMTGDHGGASEDEITSAMFVYSNIPLQSEYNIGTVVKQVDLVPTLATTLGIPIPFSNLGTIILNLLPQPHTKTAWQNLLLPLWSNLQQMVNYIKEYAKSSNVFDEDKITKIEDKFAYIDKLLIYLENKEDFEKFKNEALTLMDFIYSICEEAWTQFNPFLMSRGLILFFLIMFFTYIIVDGIPMNRLSEIFSSSFVPFLYISLAVVSVISYILYALDFVDSLLFSILFSNGMISVFMLGMLVIQNWEIISINWYERNKNKSWLDFIYRIILLFYALVPLSNSFVVEEASVSFFLLTSSTIVICFECTSPIIKNKKNKSEKDFVQNKWLFWNAKLIAVSVLALGLLRLSRNFWRCREEQSWCSIFGAHHNIKSDTELSKEYYVMTLIFLASFVIVTRNWLRSCGNLKGFSITVTLFRYAPIMMVVCTGGYWILQKMPQKEQRKFYFSQPVLFAWIVYITAFATIISTIVKPLCIYVIPKKKDRIIEADTSVPNLFHQIKRKFDCDKGDNLSNTPVVYGLATVYSTSFIIVGVIACLLFALLLGCTFASSIIIMNLFAVFLLFVASILRSNKIVNSDNELKVPDSVIIAWMLVSHYFFYGTGHQPTFPNIPWEAAFVGSTGNFTSYIVPASLLIMNIFGSYIITGFLVPLLVISPFTVHTIFPNLLLKKYNLNFSKGEIYFYENDEQFLTSTFLTCCKYILLHGIQVFLCMMAATIHCRHLMVWKIFAPKLIFEGIAFFVSMASVLLGYLFLINVNSKVGKFITQLNKQR